MRTSPSGPWMPFDADEFFTTDPPAFVWCATIREKSIIEIAARDKFIDGKGNMAIRPFFLFNVADKSGEEIDQGSLIRYLAEMIWFPQAATSDYLTWTQLDTSHAKVTMQYQGMKVSGIYEFNSDGLVSGFEAKRFRDIGTKYQLQTWVARVLEYRSFNGVMLGYKTEVTWKSRQGDFTWLRLDIVSVE